MAILGQGSKIIPGSRSHTSLIKSLGDSPSESWIIDENLKGLFDYHYGGWALSKVVIPRGTLVGLTSTQQDDYRNLIKKPAITFAHNTVGPIGVAPYNYYRRFNDDGSIARDLPEGDDFQPGITTREYITVPYLPNPLDVYTAPSTVATANVNTAKTALRFYWGCATNEYAAYARSDVLTDGCFVKAGPFGKFVKWQPNVVVALESVPAFTTAAAETTQIIYPDYPVKTGTTVTCVGKAGTAAVASIANTVLGCGAVKLTGLTAETSYTLVTISYTSALMENPALIVGQVLSLEKDVPPEGWLKYVEPEQETIAGRSIDSMRDPDWAPTPPPTSTGPYVDYDFKWPVTPDYRSPGAFKTIGGGVKGLTDGANIVQKRAVDTIASGTDHVHVSLDSSLTLSTSNTIAKVLVGGTEVSSGISLDRDTKVVTVTVASNVSADTTVEVLYRIDLDAVGTPPQWDYIGSVGAANILLKF